MRTDKENISTLFQLAKHSNGYTSLGALNALGSIGSEEEIILGLIEIISDPGSQVRGCAAEIIGRLKFRSAIPYLKALIEQHSDSGVRLSAVYALRITKLEEAIPSLCQAIRDKDDWVVKTAVEALGNIDSDKVIPCLLDATSNSDPLICRTAASYLREISSNEKLGEILSKESVRLAHMLNHIDKIVRQQIVYILWNIGSEEIIPLLRERFIDYKADIDLGIALLLGKFGCSEALPGLLKAMESTDERLRDLAVYALGQIKGDFTAYLLPNLLALISTPAGEDAFRAIAFIQSRCQFYNYEIFQAAQTAEATTQSAEDLIHDKLNAIAQGVQKMSDVPKYSFPNAQKVQIIEQIETYNENNYATDPEAQQALEDLQQTIANLQRQYPQATETEAATIIDAEFTTIQTTQPKRWQNFLKLKRLWNGVKKGSLKVGEYYAEETAWGKGLIGLLEGITDEVE